MRIFFSLLLLIPALPFAAEEPAPAPPAAEAGRCIKSIDVAISFDALMLPEERAQILDQYQLPTRIEDALQCAAYSYFNREEAKYAKLKVKITGFRMRPDVVSAVAGTHAGRNYIRAEVSLEREGQVVSLFRSSASNRGGSYSPVMPSLPHPKDGVPFPVPRPPDMLHMPAPTRTIDQLAKLFAEDTMKKTRKALWRLMKIDKPG